MVGVREFVPFPLPERGRVGAQVEGHVVDGAARHLHELALRMAFLKMQPTERAAARPAVVVLHERQPDAGLGVALGVVALQEEAARITEHGRLHDQYAGQGRFADGHGEASGMRPVASGECTPARGMVEGRTTSEGPRLSVKPPDLPLTTGPTRPYRSSPRSASAATTASTASSTDISAVGSVSSGDSGAW